MSAEFGDADYYGKKKRKWNKKKGLPKYVKKSSKSQGISNLGRNTDPFFRSNDVYMDRENVCTLHENPHYKDFERIGRYDYKKQGKRRKKLRTTVGISVSKRKGWKELENLKKRNKEMKRGTSSSDSEEEDSVLVVDNVNQETRKYNNYENEIEYIKDRDRDYMDYVESKGDLSKFSRKKRRRIEKKLENIKKCEEELERIKNIRFFLDTCDVHDRKGINREFEKGRGISGREKRRRNGYDRKKRMVAPKSKKRRDIDNHVKGYFSKRRHIMKSKNCGVYF